MIPTGLAFFARPKSQYHVPWPDQQRVIRVGTVKREQVAGSPSPKQKGHVDGTPETIPAPTATWYVVRIYITAISEQPFVSGC